MIEKMYILKDKIISFDSVLGIGTSATVYKVFISRYGKQVETAAVKHYRSISGDALMEMEVYRKTSDAAHCNISKLCDHMYCDGGVLLVFDVMKDLQKILQEKWNFDESLAFDHVSRGLFSIHEQGIMHRDLKPANIMFHNGFFKISDFGLSTTKCGGDLTPQMVTLWYRAPEILLNMPYDKSSDLWSLALVGFEMIARRPLLPGATELEMKSKIETLFNIRDLSRVSIQELDELPLHSLPRTCTESQQKCQECCVGYLQLNPKKRMQALQTAHEYGIELKLSSSRKRKSN